MGRGSVNYTPTQRATAVEHSVRRQWNAAVVEKECRRRRVPLFRCHAADTVNGRELSAHEKFMVLKSKSRQEQNQEEKAGLPDTVDLFVGMKVMVTLNVSTDLDVANGARGEIIDIVLDEREGPFTGNEKIIILKHPPAYVLVRLLHSKASCLQGLPRNVIPLLPACKSFSIIAGPHERKRIRRSQLPLTAAYALTDYRGQGQTIAPIVVDIGRPPSGELTAFNAYVALSWGKSRHLVRLLRDFDDKLFTTHPSEYL